MIYYYFIFSYKKILSLLIHIKEQNKEILTILHDKRTTATTSQFRLKDLAVKLPVSTERDLQNLETYLKNDENLSIMVNICY